MKVGYARVSSEDQDLTIQVQQLKDQGCEKIFSEKSSGSGTESRTELHALLSFVREGDVVIVTKTDRIARNTLDALKIADDLAAKSVGLKLLDLGDMDINSDIGRVIYAVISAFAEMELKRIRKRQQEGIARAKANGKKLGRKTILTPHLIERVHSLYGKYGEKKRVADELGISRTIVYKALRL